MPRPTHTPEPTSAPIHPLFLRYAIPSVLGLLSLTTAGLVDGVFLGRWSGVDALAAITLLIPLMTFIFGITLMLGIGGAVLCGNYQGAGNAAAANAIFSKTIICLAVTMAVMFLLIIWQLTPICRLLGGTTDIIPEMRRYMLIISGFTYIYVIAIGLYFFFRVDKRPYLCFFALFTGSVGNIVLDAYFIAWLGWGVAGAAWASGISFMFTVVILLTYFFHPDRQLKFIRVTGGWSELLAATANGFSELVNEFSSGIIIFIFNLLLIKQHGADGVAAFAMVNYCIFIGFMLAYGIADGTQVLISQNCGASKAQRVGLLASIAVSYAFGAGVIIAVILLIWPKYIINFFIDDLTLPAAALALSYLLIITPTFIFSGINIVLSSGYFTAVKLPVPSGAITIARALLLPCIILWIITYYGLTIPLIAAIPLAEFCTFIFAIYLLLRRPPRLTCTAGKTMQPTN